MGTKEEQIEEAHTRQNSESQLDSASKVTDSIGAFEDHTQRMQIRRRPSGKIAYMLSFFGIIAFISSVVFNSPILAFIGLGLVLWGVLFFYVKPAGYVRKDVLEATALMSLVNIHKILNELEYKGKPIHFPPRSLKELEEPVLYISKKGAGIPHLNAITERGVHLDQEGISIVDPGQGLLLLYERELGANFAEKNLDYLKTWLPKLLVEDLEMVDYIEIDQEDDTVHVKIKGSIYKALCKQLKKQAALGSLLECPLCNSIACALAKVTDRAVIVENREVSSDEVTVKTLFRLFKV